MENFLCYEYIYIYISGADPGRGESGSSHELEQMCSRIGYVYIVSREILTNNLCKRLLNISILMQFTLI